MGEVDQCEQCERGRIYVLNLLWLKKEKKRKERIRRTARYWGGFFSRSIQQNGLIADAGTASVMSV